MAVLHVQQGGSSTERYLHIHDNQAEADACRESCAEGSYNVGPDHVTRCKLTPAVISLIDELLTDAGNLG